MYARCEPHVGLHVPEVAALEANSVLGGRQRLVSVAAIILDRPAPIQLELLDAVGLPLSATYRLVRCCSLLRL